MIMGFRQISTAGLIVLGMSLACSPTSEPLSNQHNQPIFTDVAKTAGLDFTHQNGMTGDYHFPEIMGSGGALIDFDQDGDLDVYLCQGQQLADGPLQHGGGRFFRNDSTPKSGLHFTDITESTGIVASDFGMGAASADFDNDGFPDLYLLNFGSNRLWRNKGDGSFEDVTLASNTGDSTWSVSATWLDYDRDGWLDLFVVNYVDYSPTTNKDCILRGRDYCNPQSYNPVPDRLFRNNGDGTFEDVTASSQIASAFGNGLGVVSVDLNRDGWQDLYVANDGMPNQLWRNKGDGTFEEWGLLTGSALNLKGIAEASMGIATGDYDADGDFDLFMTHLRSETNTLFSFSGNAKSFRFQDVTTATQLSAASRSMTGFGTNWLDFDNDGWLDVFVANGSVAALEDLQSLGDIFPYAQSNQMFRNTGNGTFEDISDAAGPDVTLAAISRGAMFGDLDNDGDTDIIVSNNHSPVHLLRNNKGSSSEWVGLRLLEKPGGRDLLGTIVEVKTSAGKVLTRHVQTDGSYAVANDPRVLIGLGSDRAVEVTVFWPDGTQKTTPITQTKTWITLYQHP